MLPSNSPGVHGLWIPAIAMKMPLVLRPGSAEPWTPFRIIQALMKAGVPGDAFNYFPSDHAGAGEIVRRCGRSMFFGDVGAVGAFAGDPRIELHGPGYSKVVLGADRAPRWRESLDVIAKSIAENGGRSCVNASGVWTPSHGREIAEALAARLAGDRAARGRRSARRASRRSWTRASRAAHQRADRSRPAEPGAEDVSARIGQGPRLVELNGSTYLLPTVIHCTSSSHPLANREFLFPFASVVDVTAEEMAAMPECLGRRCRSPRSPTIRRSSIACCESDLIGRLNLGPIPDEHDRLGPAARGQSVRSPVRAPRVSRVARTRVTSDRGT